MINRVIIRIKLLQVVYSYYQKESADLNLAEKELMFSLQKTYDLYHYLLLLIPALTDAEQKRLDLRKHKYLATASELNPNVRFADNRFAEQLRKNKQLQAFYNEKGSIWVEEDTPLIKNLLESIVDSDIYKSYLDSEDNYASDQEFWRKIFKDIVCKNEGLHDFLEDKSIYWNDDMEITSTFVLKTMKKFDETENDNLELLPMFKSEEDRLFAIELLHKAILNEKDYNERINNHIKNWDLERIANMDLYIMQIAIAELLNFPSIPVNVTLNEYIDIAKFYSTSKSGTFINGILDAVVNELKKENKLFKN
ncbi:MAG: transcription antitermination factor NusB [Dysgonamonadaceae bacterium]|jgi:N utilization substance protein B|nr:transcription antitermination factor NusB [Dysgonamonadaceae bacterium]